MRRQPLAEAQDLPVADACPRRIAGIAEEDDPRARRDGGKQRIDADRHARFGSLHIGGAGLPRRRLGEEIAISRGEHLVARAGIGPHEAADQLHGARAADDEGRVEAVDMGDGGAQVDPVGIGVEGRVGQGRLPRRDGQGAGGERALVLGQRDDTRWAGTSQRVGRHRRERGNRRDRNRPLAGVSLARCLLAGLAPHAQPLRRRPSGSKGGSFRMTASWGRPKIATETCSPFSAMPTFT